MGDRLVVWCGDPSYLSEPTFVRALETGVMPMSFLGRLRRFEDTQRIEVIPGSSEHFLTPESGFSRTYRFGPRQFGAWMDEADAALLFGNEWDRWQFMDVTETPGLRVRPPLGRDNWARLLVSFEKLSAYRRDPSENPADFRREFRRRQINANR